MRKKCIAVFVCVALLLTCATALVACDNNKGNGVENKTSIVYLGDSIAEGILGASPVSLRHEYAYANIVGRRNDYRYVNHSVSGHLTADLLALLTNKTGYDGARMLISNVRTADIIHISILGNDLLQDMNMNQVVLEAAEDTYFTIDRIIREAEYNIADIVTKLKELNADATIIFQNVYNPLSENSTLVDAPTREALRTQYGVYPEDYRELGGKILSRLNGVLTNYLDEHPGAFHIVDAQAEFDRIYEADPERGKSLIYPDYIHPSNEGHAVLADATQRKLEELKLANADFALKEYKTMRVNLLKNHFAKAVSDIDVAVAQINAMTSCEAVTEVFFQITDGKIPEYKNEFKPTSTPDTVVETTYKLSDESSVWGLVTGPVLSLIVDIDKSCVILRNNGTMTLRLIVRDDIMDNLGSLESLFPDLNIDSMLATFNVTYLVDTYLKNLFPGFVQSDISGSFGLMDDSFGAHFLGLEDKTDPVVANLIDALQQGGLPSPLQLPAGFGVEMNATYEYRTVTDVDGNTYQAVYLTPYDSDTQPYVVMTVSPATAEKAEQLRFMIDFIKLDFIAYKV